MTRYVSAAVWLGLVLFWSVPAAHAVTGNVTVTVETSSGEPVPGAVVSFAPLDDPGAAPASIETDDEGRVVADFEEGRYRVAVASQDGRYEERVIAVPAGGSVDVGFEPIRSGWGSPNPSAPFYVGVRIGFVDVDDMPLTRIVDTQRLILDGEVAEEVVNEADHGEQSALFENPLSSDSIALNVAARLYPGWFSDRANEHFKAAVTGTIGQADVGFAFRNEAVDNEFEDSGLLWGVGLEATWDTGEIGAWYLGGGYRYRTVRDVETMRNPPVDTGGGELLQDSAELDFTSHRVQFMTGYGFESWSPYVGVRGIRREVSLDGRVRVDFSELAGGPAVQEVDFINEAESEDVEGIAGASFRFGDSSLLGSIEAAVGGDSESFSASLTYDWR